MKNRTKIMLNFVKPHKFKFIILFTCVLITTFVGSIYPYIFGRLVDEVFYGKDLSVFYQIIIMYGAVFLFNQAFHLILNMSWANLMTRFLYDIRKAIFLKTLAYEGKTLASIHSGDIIYRMGTDVEQFMNYIHWNTFYLAARVIDLILAIGFLSYIFWPFAIFAVAFTPIIVSISRHFAKKVSSIYKSLSDSSGILSSWLFEIIKGLQEVKLLSATKGVISDYTGSTIKIARLQIKANRVEVVSERINSGVSLLWQLVLYIVSAIFIISGNLTLGGFTACVAYFGKCISAFNALNNHLTGISGNMVSVDRVCTALNIECEREDGEFLPVLSGNIEFCDVHFAYSQEIEVLKGISFSVHSGERIALVGRSGAGKSTIANMLLGFYEASSGKVTIDNHNISDFNLHSLREQVGIVHQETIIFDGTIRYNLIFTDDNSRDEELINALKQASLYEFITSLPEGLDTEIGASGRELSGGQKQRLAVARIFLKNPKILIFDEATSSLDSEAEQIIKDSWDELCEGRTIIIIAHRLSTILGADKILVLQDGIIVGYDSHDQLLETCKTYNELFKEQYVDQGGDN